MMEGATPGMERPPVPIVVTINISGLTLEGDDANREDGLGRNDQDSCTTQTMRTLVKQDRALRTGNDNR